MMEGIKMNLLDHSVSLMHKFCVEIKERCVGSQGNRQATDLFQSTINQSEWFTELQEFDAIDWKEGGARLMIGHESFEVFVSPYSLDFEGCEELAAVSDPAELESSDFQGKILILYGKIAQEQLMPKNFVFYNPEEHQKIISLLEKNKVKALICATGRNPELAGGVYPFPLIEDGDFDIPSVYMTEEEGKRLIPLVGGRAELSSISERIPGKGYNVVARKGDPNGERVVVTAHIDAKKGTPGAIDNASGVTILLLLAELLKRYHGNKLIEIVALNGEDYYAVSGQMKYIRENQNQFDNVLLNINIDGAGLKQSKSTFSLFNLPAEIKSNTERIIKKNTGIVEGIPWPQGDHSIFLQYGRPAIAVSSQWFIENMDFQDITHTPKDNLEIIDYEKIVEIAAALAELIEGL